MWLCLSKIQTLEWSGFSSPNPLPLCSSFFSLSFFLLCSDARWQVFVLRVAAREYCLVKRLGGRWAGGMQVAHGPFRRSLVRNRFTEGPPLVLVVVRVEAWSKKSIIIPSTIGWIWFPYPLTWIYRLPHILKSVQNKIFFLLFNLLF